MPERPLPPDIPKMIQEEIGDERPTDAGKEPLDPEEFAKETKMDVGTEGVSEAPGEAAEENIGQMIEKEVGGPEKAAKKEGGEPLSEKFIATLKGSEGEPPEPSEIDDIAVSYALKIDNAFDRSDTEALKNLEEEYLAEVKKFSPKNEKGEIDDERFEPGAVVTKLQDKLKELHDVRRDLGQEPLAAEIRAFSDSLDPSGAAERIGEAWGVDEFLQKIVNTAETPEERAEYEKTIQQMLEADQEFVSAKKKETEGGGDAESDSDIDDAFDALQTRK